MDILDILFGPRNLNAWDQLVYDAVKVNARDRVYSPFHENGRASANAALFTWLGRGYTVLPTNYRMEDDEVTKLLNQTIESYQPYTTYSTFKIEDGRARRVEERRPNSFEHHLGRSTGGKLKIGKGYDLAAYYATQDLVKAEREMAAAKQRQAEQQARQQAEQQAAAKRAEAEQARVLAEQQKRAAAERAKAEAAKAEAERDRVAAEKLTRQQRQFKASTESGNLQSGGDTPTVITGKANSPTTNSDLSIGRGGNRRRGSSLSTVLGLF